MFTLTENEMRTIRTNMAELLDEYDYEYNYSALDKIINTWATKKSTLIEAFKKHPNYVEGKFCIAFDSDYNREINLRVPKDFSTYLVGIMEKYMDNIPEVVNNRCKETYGYYKIPYILYSMLANLEYHAFRTLTEEDFNILNNIIPEIHPHAGEKTSRVINRICTFLGYNKDPNYNREFAKYADSLSPMIIKRHTVISLNPLDYLTMSFGNSWASCHTIDKRNKRGMPNSYEGQYSSGTMSYMLDQSSMVFYTVDKDYEGDDYWTQPKINRQMFHYGEDKLVQGRLYPQSNDGNSDEYTIYRQIVQEVIAMCFDMPNLWTVAKGTEHSSRYIISRGTHYKDYQFFDNCTLSKNKSKQNEECFTVGAEPICIECGYTHNIEESINCCSRGYRCAGCGEWVSDEDCIHEIGGEYYCEDCCEWCDCCNEWHRQESTYINSQNIYVCEDCLDEYYTRCEHCNDYENNEDCYAVIDEYGDEIYVCEYCFDHYYHTCEECNNSYKTSEMIRVANGDYVCQDCLEEKYRQCKHCGEWYAIDEINEVEEDVFYCDDCLPEDEEAV